MRLPGFLILFLLCLWMVAATSLQGPGLDILPKQNSASKIKTQAQSATRSPAKARSSATATASKTPKAKKSGLTKAQKIGIAVGVPLGVLVIVGAVAAYILGKKRGRKQRVDDSTAGANKLVKDPSPELSLSPDNLPPPAVAELPTIRSDEFGHPCTASAHSVNSQKHGYTVPFDAPQPPQEMPAGHRETPQSPQEMPA